MVKLSVMENKGIASHPQGEVGNNKPGSHFHVIELGTNQETVLVSGIRAAMFLW